MAVAQTPRLIKIACSLGVGGAVSSGVILLACLFRLNNFIEQHAVILLFVALALLGGTSIVFLWGRLYKPAGVVAFIFVVVLVLSMQPWYVEHWTPWGGGQTHLHTIWELGHTH